MVLRPDVFIGLGFAVGSLLVAAHARAEEPQASATPAAAPAATAPAPAGIQNGMMVQIDYTLTVDGAVVDSSQGRSPLSYVQGQGEIIPGLEKQLAGLKVGDARDVTVAPEEGYGAVDPQAYVEVPKTQLPPEMTPAVGLALQGTSKNGQPFRATISKVDKDTVILNLNHPLAGKTLHFAVKVVKISPAN
ncbi:MAG: peptidylprolyl isomerase [Candidatus Omnitrophica bacterium]|nr:peptidylprolyl isomerase [Candidatus Omnitrophota bacterium]